MKRTEELSADRGVQHIAVCIPTCRRPRMLAACLEAVARLDSPNTCRVSIIVGDNDRSRR
jgi:hypothetical protein